ncbi:hypothetical protein LCGC14_0947920 [marine sediment metagenome]|uniref:Uncharacterized protein n=1 Tax=marine sediment metagenome TaxID=412755 RepID=A0A0F9RPJ3_9ZZZZ
MRLIDLNPQWVRHGGGGITHGGKPVSERKRVGLGYDCPCGCGDRRYVPFANPEDGQGPLKSENPAWERTGTDFETLTLSPSIRHVPVDPDDCSWHGWIKNGEVTNA